MKELYLKFKEVLTSVFPISVIVLILHFSLTPLKNGMLYTFLFGSFLVICGLTLFLYGVDKSLEPIGKRAGSYVSNSKSYAVIITVSLIIGFFISFAEPDLHILSKQVNLVTSGQLNALKMVIVVSIGIGVMMTLGMLRIMKNVSLKIAFTVIYSLIFIISMFSSKDFLAIAFDSSGATTGAITVPFMLALASGITNLKGNKKIHEADSFGLVGISSSGAILGILTTSLFLKVDKLNGSLPHPKAMNLDIFESFTSQILHISKESFLTLLPIIIIYLVLLVFHQRDDFKRFKRISFGLVITYIGLVTFLVGVNGGFMEVGSHLGIKLASMNSKIPVLTVALFLGLSTVLAEPAVHVLTHEVESITHGGVKKGLVLIFLSISVGLAISMSALRVMVIQIELWMFVLPGFLLAIILAFFIPDLFVGMAFDAGGVASGPMTATFSLAFIQGIAEHIPTADVVSDGFGMIAIVAMMPIIAIELLGVIYRIKKIKTD